MNALDYSLLPPPIPTHDGPFKDVCPSNAPVSDDLELNHVLHMLKSAMFDNVVGLILCVVIVLITAMVLWSIVTTCWDLVARWRKHTTLVSGVPAPPSLNEDDVALPPDGGDGLESLPPKSETSAIRARMAKLQQDYKGYNAAMKRLALHRGDVEADDLMDMSILTRSKDDFLYPHRPRNERLRFRRGEGAEFVTVDHGTIGVRSPIYSKQEQLEHANDLGAPSFT